MINKCIINPIHSNSIFVLRDILSKEFLPIVKEKRQLVIVCIGSDRSTGDSLGPLVGENLKFLSRDSLTLYGNLENPVHAKNISSVMTEIQNNYVNPYIIAVDACLGALQNVGNIIVESIPLCPGAALKKDLPKIGNLSITGVVNISGSMEFMVLQNTRLFTVMQIADTISKGLYHSIIKTFGGNKNSYKNRSLENI